MEFGFSVLTAQVFPAMDVFLFSFICPGAVYRAVPTSTPFSL